MGSRAVIARQRELFWLKSAMLAHGHESADGLLSCVGRRPLCPKNCIFLAVDSRVSPQPGCCLIAARQRGLQYLIRILQDTSASSLSYRELDPFFVSRDGSKHGVDKVRRKCLPDRIVGAQQRRKLTKLVLAPHKHPPSLRSFLGNRVTLRCPNCVISKINVVIG